MALTESRKIRYECINWHVPVGPGHVWRHSVPIPNLLPTVQTCTVAFRICPEIESVRSPLWAKKGRLAGNCSACGLKRVRCSKRMEQKSPNHLGRANFNTRTVKDIIEPAKS